MSKKVLYTASTYSHIKNFHLPYLRFLKEQGLSVTVMAGGKKAPIPFADFIADMPFQKKFFSPGNFVLAFKIAGLIRKQRFHMICTNTALAAFFTRLAVILAGKRDTAVVNIVHGYLFDDHVTPVKKAVMLLAERITAPVTDIVLTMNGRDTEIAEKHRLAAKGVFRIDGMGVDLKRFRALERAEKRPAGICAEDFLLICAAEFSKRKNQRMLISALKGLPDGVKLFLLGDGELLGSCKQLAEEAGLSARVFFPGHITDVSEYYKIADVCVSASRIEGLPFHIMEAMASGLAVVASRIKGHEDLIADGENGFLFEYNCASEFAEAVMKLYEDRQLCAQIGSRNRTCAEKYSLEAVSPEIKRLFLNYL